MWSCGVEALVSNIPLAATEDLRRCCVLQTQRIRDPETRRHVHSQRLRRLTGAPFVEAVRNSYADFGQPLRPPAVARAAFRVRGSAPLLQSGKVTAERQVAALLLQRVRGAQT